MIGRVFGDWGKIDATKIIEKSAIIKQGICLRGVLNEVAMNNKKFALGALK